MDLKNLARRYRVTRGASFRLSQFDPNDSAGLDERKDDAPELLARSTKLLAEHQDVLYSDDRHALLLIFQAMDAAGKDGTIKHVMAGVNPQGCQVFAFKAPSAEELDHDFLWRTWRCLPERGRIGIFNRSYYEEVLVARVEPEVLARQKLPPALVGPRIWKERFEDIRSFERYLHRNGTTVLKFYLHVSKDEQRKRLLERIDRPDKNWKFDARDLDARKKWAEYQHAYEDAIRNTASEDAPWFVVPADKKWFTRLVVSSVVVETLRKLKLAYPRLTKAQTATLRDLRAELEPRGKTEGGKRGSEKSDRDKRTPKKRVMSRKSGGDRPGSLAGGTISRA
jgi:PPK2 family polyphosphate:nucleotide phosphotransferase